MLLKNILLSTLPLALALSLASGCSQSLDQNQTFQEKMALVDRINEDLNALNGRLSSMDAELQAVSKDVVGLKTMNVGGSPDTARAIEERLIRLENSLKTANDTIMAMQQKKGALPLMTSQPETREMAKAAPTAGQAVLPADDGNGEAAGKIDHAAVAEAQGDSGKTEKTASRKTAMKPEKKTESKKSEEERQLASSSTASRKSGGYYQVKQGDSLASIAAANKVDLNSLRSANRLPGNANPIIGARIYIPSN